MKPQRRLGRGLDALMRLPEVTAEGASVFEEAVQMSGPSVLQLSRDVAGVADGLGADSTNPGGAPG
jgi:hypothetical protein